MEKFIVVIYILSLFLFDCNNSTGPNSDLEFSKMEIQYKKSGGWINTSKLYIYGNGLVNAYHIAHASLDTIDSTSALLSQNDQRKIVYLFVAFANYDSNYEPNPWYTDGNYHVTIFVYEGKADTVTVYEPNNANIPEGLNKIIQEMESLWQSMFD
jgi:hypothetical protein